MNISLNDKARALNWYAQDAGSLEELRAQTDRVTDPADWPLAAAIEQNVPIYDGAMVRGLRSRAELMSEWAAVFLGGPGIIVIKNAFADLAVLDRASALFTDMIEREKASGAGGGDHFAKPGANDRVWNALQKHCVADPEGYAAYYGNVCLSTAAYSWLGPNYQFTAQVNRVNPGGAAQAAHRDYHLGFMTQEDAARWPVHAHALSPALTLQGAIAHVDMPLESGPTLYLPYSQTYGPGYVAFTRPEFQEHFTQNRTQLPLEKGDAVFFNPALMHAAGQNTSKDIFRLANLLQVGSAFGRSIEAIDRTVMCRAVYPTLAKMHAEGTLDPEALDAVIATTAEGYAYPTNLDIDPPAPGNLAPLSQADMLRQALASATTPEAFAQEIDQWSVRRQP